MTAATSARGISPRSTDSAASTLPAGGSSVSIPGLTIRYSRPLSRTAASALPFARR